LAGALAVGVLVLFEAIPIAALLLGKELQVCLAAAELDRRRAVVVCLLDFR